MGDLVLGAVLLARRRGVAAADHRHGARRCGLDHRVHEALGARLELGHLEDAHGAVPDDGLRVHHRLLVGRDGLRAAVEGHEAIGDALRLRCGLDLAVLAELGGDDEVRRQDDLDPELLGLLHDLRHDLRALLVVQGPTDGHAVVDLQERVRHASADDHLVDLVQHVHDQLNLVRNLRAAQDGQHRLRGRLEHLRERVQLLGHQAAGALHLVALADHGAVRAVGGAERVVAVDVRQGLQRRAELGDGLLVGLDLVAVLVDALALLLKVEAQVLEKDDAARRGVRASLLHLLADAIRAERHRLAQLLLDDLGHRSHRVLGDDVPVRAAQVRGKHHRLGAPLQDALDRRQGAVDALRVRDLRGVGLVLGHVEVHAHEDALARHIDVVDLQLRRHGSGESVARQGKQV
mmetsp:Transcript_14825/g.34080  ORF Transcript_14825/g.34080 Transcript_14825/m.34080 type:complete len:405 (-) Transcript_14825:16-1230(-)